MIKSFIACALFLTFTATSLQIQASNSITEKKDPDDDLLFMDMVKSHNYNAEQHIVTT